jgi:hypothetical protein
LLGGQGGNKTGVYKSWKHCMDSYIYTDETKALDKNDDGETNFHHLCVVQW